MAAVLGKAIVSYGGRILELAPLAKDWNALLEGGRFSGEDLTIEVNPGAVVARQGQFSKRDASVSIFQNGRGFAISHGPQWACSS